MLGGATDYLLGALAVGGEGAITGMANACPRACLKAYELAKTGKHAEALKLGGLISRAEWSLGKGGLLGTKVRYAVCEMIELTRCSTRRPSSQACLTVLRSVASLCQSSAKPRKRTLMPKSALWLKLSAHSHPKGS